MKNHIYKIKYLIILILIFSFSLCALVFAENINVRFSYGINNVAKNDVSIPIELTLTNYDDRNFNGTAKINVYESNESIFVYYVDVSINSHSTEIYNEDISVSNTQNTIIIEIINDKEELVTTERTSLDLSQNNDKIIIGAITHDFKSLSYIDDIDIEEYGLKTKLVEITEEKVLKNKNILNILDVLLISDVNYQSFSDTFKFAIDNYIKSDKLTILSLGGNNGIFSMPDSIIELLSGPSIEVMKKITLPFGNKLSLTSNVTICDIVTGNKIFKYDENVYSERIKLNEGEIITIPFSLNEFSSYGGAYEYFKIFITKSFSNNKLTNISDFIKKLRYNDYYNIGNILSIIDKVKLPDIFIISCVLIFYVIFCSIFLYIYMRNSGKRQLYLRYVFIISIIFSILMLIKGSDSMRKNVSLTYSSIVDINGANTKEKAFLNFRVNESGNFNLHTNLNNKISPIIKNKNEAIMSTNFIDNKKIKVTNISKVSGEKNIDVINPKDFESNIFLYENSNYLNEIYNIDVNVSRFDDKVTGRVTNKMGIEIKNAFIILFGKVIKLGNVNSNTSISINRGRNIGVPVGNNQVLSEIISDNDSNFVKYYLDENIKGYFDEAYFLGFIDNNGTIDIKSKDVGSINGKTLLVKKVELDKEPIFSDICVLKNSPSVLFGNYDYESNSIYGDTDVILEYYIDTDALISRIYFEDIESYDHGNIESSIPFYGEKQIYNYNTESFEDLLKDSMDYEDLKKYLSIDNKFIVRYYQITRDPMYRKISLPIPRVIISQ